MKQESWDRMLFLCIGLLMGIGFILLFSFIWVNVSEDKSSEEGNIKIAESEQEIIDNCSNLDVVNASYCLIAHIKPFFIYNVTDDDLELSFEEIKERGGDCRDWSFLSERLGKDLGFNATTVRNDGVKGLFSAHRYAILWDDKNYCKLDLINNVRCYKIKNT